jgi:hypothetical protein
MNKKIFVLLLFLMTVSINTFSQKLYVWCQKEQIPSPRNGFLSDEEINLIIFDGRTMTPKSKIECNSETIIKNLALTIKQTYKSAKINLLTSDNYYQKPAENTITIKIAISAYQAGFSTNLNVGIGSVGGSFSWGAMPENKWNAATGYSVKVYDYRNGAKIKKNKEIGKVESRSNNAGFKTAKNILNTTYVNANQELFFFIDECLME